MIAKLRGIIDTIGDDYCIVDVNGVGYLVFASAKTLGKLTRGKQYCLLTETVVREDSISLFGFYDAWEKEWFLTLTKVQGVGAKVCLSILSVLSPSQLAQAVAAQDKNSFTRASGVGPKPGGASGYRTEGQDCDRALGSNVKRRLEPRGKNGRTESCGNNRKL